MIELNNIDKTYNIGKSNAFQALKDVSLTIEDGEMVAIIGKSGAGKSTLMHIIGCIDDFESGTYILNGEDISSIKEGKRAKIRNKDIGIVMQDFALVEDYTAIENVMIPLYFAKGKLLESKKSIAKKALEKVGIGELASKRVNKLSGGQKQRVAIARAIVNNPSILLADEPTGALDVKTSAEIMGVFKELNEQGITVIIITHDMEVAEGCERVIEISDGRIKSA
ncbi:MAG: ABC transporter ATP-binding protein [Lachnospiraceae bacterium]|nr:ABC transporter ATP-binding protein [Lachnospiraceae bacterium]